MRQDEIDQRPALERTAAAVRDAQDGVTHLRAVLVNLTANGKVDKEQTAPLREAIRGLDGPLMAALSAIGEVAP